MDRPAKGEIDCLIGYDYAAFHPVKIQSIDNLLLLKNQFGYVIGRTHPSIVEEPNKVIQQGMVNHVSATVEDFYTFESLCIQCKPQCGSCKCGKCHRKMSLQEEKEYKLIEYIIYDHDCKKWIASYPRIKNPMELPDNRDYVLAALK